MKFSLKLALFSILFIQEVNAQKKFSVSIKFPSNIDTKGIKISYDNGKDEIDSQPIIKNNSFTITDTFYSKYATILISYSNEKNNYYNSFLGQTHEI